jgi:SNF2 family DNA or RNA helicase
VVVFARFTSDVRAIHEAAKKAGRISLELSGHRHELERWQAGEGTVIAVQIHAGGLGVDLTRACYAVYFSLGFSLGDYEQSLARLDRYGQTRPVTYYHLQARNSIDARILWALKAKKDVVESVLTQIKEHQPIEKEEGEEDDI